MLFLSSVARVGSILVFFFAFLVAYPQPEMDWQARAVDINQFYGGSRELPLQDRIVVITGATSGIGKSFASRMKELGAQIVATGRSGKKLAALRQELPGIQTFIADQSDLNSVASMADLMAERLDRVDILINNAGIHDGMFYNRDGSAATAQGYDPAFAINYLSHVLLTEKLIPALQASSNPIVLQTSSLFHWAVNGTSLISQRGDAPGASLPGGGHDNWIFRSQRSYSVSKLAQIYHARALQKRYPKLRVVSFCPNFVGTNISRQYPVFIQKVIATIGFPIDGYALSSAFDAMFVPDGGDFYSNSKIYDVFAKIFASNTINESYTDKFRDLLSSSLAGVAIYLQKFVPQRGSTPTSPQSYNSTIEGSLYLWSMGQVAPYLNAASS